MDPDGRSPVLLFLAKEAGAEAFEAITGVPLLTTKNLIKGGAEFYANQVAKKKATQLAKNKVAGKKFENEVMGQLQNTQTDVVKEVTVKTKSGTKTRIDLIGRDSNGNIACTECKSSATAPLTTNQKKAFPEIQQSGAVVVGNGKPGFPGGTNIPPTKVDIVRP